MNLQEVMQIIHDKLSEDIEAKVMGKRTFEINLTQGGIGECKVFTENNLTNYLKRINRMNDGMRKLYRDRMEK